MSTFNPILHKNLPLLEVNDPRELDELFSDRKTADFLLARLDEHVALVDPEKLDALILRLRKLNHLPRVVNKIP